MWRVDTARFVMIDEVTRGLSNVVMGIKEVQ
jgi:hypothetical protein